MREYIDRVEGRELFCRTYGEALSVALASGVRPEKMLVDPIPPGWNGRSISGEAQDLWLLEILRSYGNLKASMLQDFERGRTTGCAAARRSFFTSVLVRTRGSALNLGRAFKNLAAELSTTPTR